MNFRVWCCLLSLVVSACAGNPETKQSNLETFPSQAKISQPATDTKAPPPVVAVREYKNRQRSGPDLVVLPGEIKTNDPSFEQSVSINQIADYAEHELQRANFGVIERNTLGPSISELKLAVNMGDTEAVQRLRGGRLQATRFFVAFDILRAEPVAKAKEGFSGPRTSTIMDLLSKTPVNNYLRLDAATVESKEEAKVWLIGLRYRVLDAATTEQIATGYYEEKMELGSKMVGVLGAQQRQETMVTLDTIVQLLVQKAVADIDDKGKPRTEESRPNPSPDSARESTSQH